MLGGDTAELRKARGAFYTPKQLCEYLAQWAIRSADDRILEPSCGEAAFLVSAARRLQALGEGRLLAAGELHGIELHEDSAAHARALMASMGASATIRLADFLDILPEPRYDAVIGNPPYVRYQSATGDDRLRSRTVALRGGVALTNLASSWAAFVVHASLFLREGGRLGLVLPAELLTVNYAAGVRSFLMRRFGRVRLVLFEERVFPGVLEEVVLLLAEGKGPTDHCELAQLRNLSDLQTTARSTHRWSPIPADAKWTPALMPNRALELFGELTCHGDFTTLEGWGDTTLGMVTGNNSYFALSAETVRQRRIPRSELVPLSPPGSRHLRGLSFTEKAWNEMLATGSAGWLFRPGAKPSAASQRYIADGERDSVQHAFKCRVRSPWWRVPLVKPPDLFLTYMNADTPRLCANRAAVHHLNSVHGLYIPEGLRQVAADLLPIAALNSLTVLGAELIGRAYGGGMLKLEPKEADRLPVPSPVFLSAQGDALRSLRPQIATALRGGRIGDAIALVDRVVLVDGLGIRRSRLKHLVEARSLLALRRTARGTPPRG